ncbi:hypothetical protein [Xenorhabdus nematophila]|uniref:hypothetical protein n=1 Tax=Xenorhabdus nematophila TaxID=628 RepID=UPI0012E0580A|nr:hypothetical protein [Xenorhabdus nematophila]
MQCRKEQDDVKSAFSKRRVISPAAIWLLAGRHPAYSYEAGLSTMGAFIDQRWAV